MAASPAAGSLTANRQSHSRNNSHSVLVGSGNANRVTRRKSMTNTGANAAVVAAALQEVGDQAMPLPITVSARRNTMSKNGASRPAIAGSLPSPPASLPTHRFGATEDASVVQESAIEDDLNMSGDEGDLSFDKSQVRRASDGQPLTKEGRKSNRPELRCETCGKGYKHSSCLTKHLFVLPPSPFLFHCSSRTLASRLSRNGQGRRGHRFKSVIGMIANMC